MIRRQVHSVSTCSCGVAGGFHPPRLCSTLASRRRASPLLIAASVCCTPLRYQSDQGSGKSGLTMHHLIRDHSSGATASMPLSREGTDAPSDSTSSWASRLRMELLRETDPMGGMAHKDVYRDPHTGYTPHYAPRDFATGGGAISYHHPGHVDGRSASEAPGGYKGAEPEGVVYARHAAAERSWRMPDVEQWRRGAQEERAALREIEDPKERQTYLTRDASASMSVPLHRLQTTSRSPLELIRSETAGKQARRATILSRMRVTPPGVPPHTESPSHSSLQSPFTASEMEHYMSETVLQQHDDAVSEALHMAKGGRARERFDFGFLQRSSRLPFQGYDRDRWRAHQNGTPFGSLRLPPVVPPGSMTEAQRTLREAAGLPNDVEIAQQTFLDNTTAAEPVLGEALTEAAVRALAATRAQAKESKKKAREERFGLGRKGNPLVQDGGPDQRTWKRGSNDERLRDAFLFGALAYRKRWTDEHRNPYQRRETSNGVGHLLTSAFDVQRRDDRIGRGLPDLTERSAQHLGKPIPQQLDEFVLRHRNARGERPLDYFRPFPHFRAQRLYHVYEDTEGFSLMRQRPDFLEWELFTRYRAHHQQRREIALRHGLEPVRNETANERDARRLQLDILCEKTPFDPSKVVLEDEEQPVSVEQLRAWFGAFLLPSPVIVQRVLESASTGEVAGVFLQGLPDTLGTTDTREHVLSGRYLNQLSLMEAFLHRQSRGYASELFHFDKCGPAPEPYIRYAQPESVLRHFDAEEVGMYQRYVEEESGKQLQMWETMRLRRRWVPCRGAYGSVKSTLNEVEVIDLRHAETGRRLVIPAASEHMMMVSPASTPAASPPSNRSTNTSLVVIDSSIMPPKNALVRVEGENYEVVPHTQRKVRPLVIEMQPTGEILHMTNEEWSGLPLEVPASAAYNHVLDFGVKPYSYNRGNYVETQDVLWEQHTAAAEEGWSLATHADGLLEGLPVRARRAPQEGFLPGEAWRKSASGHPSRRNNNGDPSREVVEKKDAVRDVTLTNALLALEANMTPCAASSSTGVPLVGEWERAVIVSYHHQPFFNPDPRQVTVRFASDGHVQAVPLADLQIWQRRYHGPERTVGNTTRRYNPAGLRRYVNVVDPFGTRDRGNKNSLETHFLDKYEMHSAEKTAASYRSTKQIQELDQWNAHDTRRSDNHRPLSISHRRDYVRQGYQHKYTPWEWIAIQEGDQPMLKETIRQDNVGPSFFFGLRRFWRFKARPHGYLRHYDAEVRDLLQFVDGVTPWEKAKKIRTYWEVREHHPMPQFHRPEVGMHRNSAALLPSHLWDADKKTGKVKGVKDSVRDYKTTTPLPKWVNL